MQFDAEAFSFKRSLVSNSDQCLHDRERKLKHLFQNYFHKEHNAAATLVDGFPLPFYENNTPNNTPDEKNNTPGNLDNDNCTGTLSDHFVHGRRPFP